MKTPDVASGALQEKPVATTSGATRPLSPQVAGHPQDAAHKSLPVEMHIPARADLHVLNRCKACHDLGVRARVGPGLGKGDGVPGVFGREAGTFPGFRYKFTKYINGRAWAWDSSHLRPWLCDSKKAVRTFTGNTRARTKMPAQHICDPARQDAIIAALRAIS